MINVDIKLSQKIVKPILWLTNFFNDGKAVLVCKGYGEDWDLYTGLDWAEDKNVDLNDYSDFRVWLNF